MLEIIVDILLIVMAVYVAFGLVFSIYFVFNGARRMDEGVFDTPWHFKLIIFPGAVLLWVVLLIKMVKK